MKTIYFLDWLSKESGFSVPELVEAMKPENQGWASENFVYSSPHIIFKIASVYELVEFLFDWEHNILKKDFKFWRRISVKWIEYIKQFNTPTTNLKIKFSKNYEISNDFKIKPKQLFETKILKQKKL